MVRLGGAKNIAKLRFLVNGSGLILGFELGKKPLIIHSGRKESKKTSASRASTDPSTAAATLSRGELVSPEFLSRTGGAIAFSPAYSVP